MTKTCILFYKSKEYCGKFKNAFQAELTSLNLLFSRFSPGLHCKNEYALSNQ